MQSTFIDIHFFVCFFNIGDANVSQSMIHGLVKAGTVAETSFTVDPGMVTFGSSMLGS